MCFRFWTPNQKCYTDLDVQCFKVKNLFLKNKDPFQSLMLGSFENKLWKQSDFALQDLMKSVTAVDKSVN